MAGASHRSFDPTHLTKAAAAEFSSSDSDEDDEFRVPGLGNGDDDFGDFNPRKKRRLGNSKEQAALGIFASDSEDDGPGKRWKRKSLRSKAMNFVSTAQPEKDEGESDDSEENRPVIENGDAEEGGTDDEEDEDDENAPGVGLGFGAGTAAQGLGWGDNGGHNGNTETRSEPQSSFGPAPKTRFDGSNVLGRGFVPSSASEPVLNEPEAMQPSIPRNKPQPSAFGAKGKINAKSFGARMMAKMGYVEGKGLGREGQGRNVIVEANLRPQGIGLGAVKEKTEQERQEEKRQARLRGDIVVDSDEEEKKRKRAKKKALGSAAGSSATSTPRRQKTRYLTAEELKAAAPGLHIPDAFAPILDMTGPGGKLLTSTSGIMTPTSETPQSAERTEARKLAKRAQADLRAFSEEWQSLEERKTWVNLEMKEKEQEIENLQSDFDKLQLFSKIVTEQLVSAADWPQTISCLRSAADLGIANGDITNIAVAALHPFIRNSDWNPLAEPSHFAKDLLDLKEILFPDDRNRRAIGKWNSSDAQTEGVYRRHQKGTTPYESLMYKNWLPRVLSAVRSWDPLDPTPMLNIMENWEELLPPFVRAQFMDNIARKLEAAVSDWNPRKKKQSHHLPHAWLFPWLQYLPSYHLDPKGTGLMADIRRKFRQLIDVWEYERGVVPGLKQWKDVLGSQWRSLIMSHVLPSMGKYLRTNFRIDPADQEPYLPILLGILKWNDLLGSSIMSEILVQDMFPMWISKLQEWLALDEVDLAEIAEWYSWWRGVLLKDMAASDGVKNELDKGLRIMNVV